MLLRPPSPLTPSAEQGFTLVEVLVGMAASIVVLFALFAILNFTQNQETRISEAVQADQIGRTAMSKMVEELHSSCTGVTPIREPSSTPESPLGKTGPLNLWFISAYGDSSSGEASISSVTEHDINWTKTSTSNTGKSLGTLTDYAFPSESTSKYPEWKFPSPKTSKATAKVLAYNVIPIEVNSEPTIFQYYKYESSGTKLVALPASSLSETTVEDVSKVTISFSQASASADTRADRTASFSDSVVLRIDPTESGSEGPCE